MSHIFSLEAWANGSPKWWNRFFYSADDRSSPYETTFDILNEELKLYRGRIYTIPTTMFYQLEFDTKEDFDYFIIRAALVWSSD